MKLVRGMWHLRGISSAVREREHIIDYWDCYATPFCKGSLLWPILQCKTWRMHLESLHTLPTSTRNPRVLVREAEGKPCVSSAHMAFPSPPFPDPGARHPDTSSTRFPRRPQRRLQLGRLHARSRRQLDDLLVSLATQFVSDRRRRRHDLRLGHVSILGPRRRRARRVFVCGELRGRRVCGAASAPSQQEEDAYADEGGDGDAYAQAGAESGGVGFFFWRGGGRGCWC